MFHDKSHSASSDHSSVGQHPVRRDTTPTSGESAGEVAGPIAVVADMLIGDIIAGFTGHAAAGAGHVDTYWRDHFGSRTVGPPAYAARTAAGMTARPMSQYELDLRRDWVLRTAASGLAWDTADAALREAYDRKDRD
jgi:hypothetical protein